MQGSREPTIHERRAQMVEMLQAQMPAMCAQFNSNCLNFLDCLTVAFPWAKKDLQTAALHIKGAGTDNALRHVPAQEVWKHMGPHLQSILDKDESILTCADAEKLEMLHALDLRENWAQAPEQTKGAIWSWLEFLLCEARDIASFDAFVTQSVRCFDAIAEFRQQRGHAPESQSDWDQLISSVDPGADAATRAQIQQMVSTLKQEGAPRMGYRP